ncbi:metal-dependent transcriptional regulator [Kocuria sp. M1N1S27]|uniref:metal-dependent transcriptional regulator n=1 Tax=Kocuria kalidii TaxID=3376283 RepID=UPI00378E2655
MRAEELNRSVQDCLKTVWLAQEWSSDAVTTTGLAQRLGLSPSTVSEAVKKLTAQGLLSRPGRSGIVLTDRGRDVAVQMVRRHRILEAFLTSRLGYAWDEVHDEAEVLEHAVSEKFVARLEALLGHPERDPHGDPIPLRDGTVPPATGVLLADVPAGSPVVVARVSDADPAVLRWLEGAGIRPGTELVPGEHRSREMSVDVGGTVVEVGVLAAEAVRVRPRD